MAKYDWDHLCCGETFTLYTGFADDPSTYLDCHPRMFATILGRMARRRGKEVELEFLGTGDSVTGIRFRCV